MHGRTLACVLALASLGSCTAPHRSEGERLARRNCGACHAFPEPQLLDKQTWQTGVLPQMAPRLGVSTKSLYTEAQRNPNMTVLTRAISDADWEKIVAYYVANAPDSLPPQSLPAEPQLDPDFFKPGPFVPRLQSSAVITLVKADSTHARVFIGEAGSNLLRVFDWNRRLKATVKLGSPPTGVIAENDRLLVLESGILDPNDQAKGRLVQYDVAGDSLRFARVLIDSLYRPVFVEQFDFDEDGRSDFLICEYGDNRGRLALYRNAGASYERHVLDGSPGAIRFDIRDLTGDGNPDVVALFAQGDERIVLFEGDGKGSFSGAPRVLARFPPVAVADFDHDGDLDILAASNFADDKHPERGIVYLENTGRYTFRPFAFSAATGNQWNVMTTADLNRDGRLDVIIGAMSLENIARGQRRFSGQGLDTKREPVLFFENRSH